MLLSLPSHLLVKISVYMTDCYDFYRFTLIHPMVTNIFKNYKKYPIRCFMCGKINPECVPVIFSYMDYFHMINRKFMVCPELHSKFSDNIYHDWPSYRGTMVIDNENNIRYLRGKRRMGKRKQSWTVLQLE